MGTGTSHGIPVIACDCAVCKSSDSRDSRLRCSAYVTNSESDGKTSALVIDTGPEFRIQAIKYGIKKIKAVLLTHSHADHLNGLDDIRIFSHTKYGDNCKGHDTTADFPETNGQGLPIYANSATINDAKNRFDYIFKTTQIGGGKPMICFMDSAAYSPEKPLKIASFTILPVPMLHGRLPVSGWLLSCTGKDNQKHSVVYLTDCSCISDESINLVKQNCGILDHVVIDALRVKPHTTHCNFDEALAYSERLCAKHTWFTHICHDFSHVQIQDYIEQNLSSYPALNKIVKSGGSVSPAWDGLVISCGE